MVGDKKGVILEANSILFKMTGYKREEIIGKSINIFFSNEEMQRVPLRYDLLMAGKVVTNQRYMTKKNGTKILIEMKSKKMVVFKQ